MAEKKEKRIRLSIDLNDAEFRKLKVLSSLYGETVKEYVLKSIRESMNHGIKNREFTYLIDNVVNDPVLKELWRSDKEKNHNDLIDIAMKKKNVRGG